MYCITETARRQGISPFWALEYGLSVVGEVQAVDDVDQMQPHGGLRALLVPDAEKGEDQPVVLHRLAAEPVDPVLKGGGLADGALDAGG